MKMLQATVLLLGLWAFTAAHAEWEMLDPVAAAATVRTWIAAPSISCASVAQPSYVAALYYQFVTKDALLRRMFLGGACEIRRLPAQWFGPNGAPDLRAHDRRLGLVGFASGGDPHRCRAREQEDAGTPHGEPP
jgi:hypothetical protein